MSRFVTSRVRRATSPTTGTTQGYRGITSSAGEALRAHEHHVQVIVVDVELLAGLLVLRIPADSVELDPRIVEDHVELASRRRRRVQDHADQVARELEIVCLALVRDALAALVRPDRSDVGVAALLVSLVTRRLVARRRSPALLAHVADAERHVRMKGVPSRDDRIEGSQE